MDRHGKQTKKQTKTRTRTRKKRKGNGFLHNGVSSIKKTTGKVLPGIKTNFEKIGSNVIQMTVPAAKNGAQNLFNVVGLTKKGTKKSKKSKNKSSKTRGLRK